MPKTSSSFEPGDIVIAELMFSEQAGLKRRPALVISNARYNRQTEDLILLKITSRGKAAAFDIPLSQKDLRTGSLKRESQIMADNPVTTYKGMILEKAGAVQTKKLRQVKEKLKELFEL